MLTYNNWLRIVLLTYSILLIPYFMWQKFSHSSHEIWLPLKFTILDPQQNPGE